MRPQGTIKDNVTFKSNGRAEQDSACARENVLQYSLTGRVLPLLVEPLCHKINTLHPGWLSSKVGPTDCSTGCYENKKEEGFFTTEQTRCSFLPEQP